MNANGTRRTAMPDSNTLKERRKQKIRKASICPGMNSVYEYAINNTVSRQRSSNRK